MSVSSRCVVFLCAGLLCAQTVFRKLPADEPPVPGSSQKRQKKQPSSPPKPLVLDLVAVGPKGQPVRDLTAADFTVRVENEPRKISGVTYVNAGTGGVTAGLPSVPLPPESLHPTLVVVADDLGLSAASAQKVRQTLTHFIGLSIAPSTELAIVRTAAGRGAQQKLTTDRALLANAIRAISYNPVPALDEVVHAAGARETLRQVFHGLRDLPGRKGVIVFSENPRLFENKVADPVIEAALRAGAVVTLVDLRAPAPSPEVVQQGLEALATRTGGRLLSHYDDPAAALAGALQDQQGYYLLAIDPVGIPVDVLTGRPVTQRAAVAVAKPGVQVRARLELLDSASFLTAGRQLWRPSFTTPAEDFLRGLTDPFDSGAIPVRFVALYSAGQAGAAVDSLVYIDPKDLTFTRRLNGQILCDVELQIAAFDESGGALQRAGRHYAIQFTPENLATAVEKGFIAELRLPMHAVGGFQVRVAVRDGTSGRIGSASQFIHAIDTSNGQLAIPGISLASGDPEPASAAVNRFPVRHSFKYFYQVVNLLSDASKRSEMDVQTRILSHGDVLFESKPSLVAFAASETPKVRTAAATVTPGALAPGTYILQITVTDKLAKTPRTTTAYADFELVPAN